MQVYVKEDNGSFREATTEEVVLSARRRLRRKFRKGKVIRSPGDTHDFLMAELGNEQSEIFAVMYLDNRHRILAFDRVFHGTIDGTSVYPREIIKRALEINAATLILTHCHPSGVAEPSQADERITRRIKAALELVDIRLLDHLVVAADRCVSFAQRGLL